MFCKAKKEYYNTFEHHFIYLHPFSTDKNGRVHRAEQIFVPLSDSPQSGFGLDKNTFSRTRKMTKEHKVLDNNQEQKNCCIGLFLVVQDFILFSHV